MDAAPATKGHALVLPKNHFDNIYDIDADTLGKAIQVAQKVIKHATKVLGCQGYNLLQNNGEVAGQTVFHYHLDLIPRYEDMDNSAMLKFKPGEADSDELKSIAEAMKIE
jgi:histidine triad (HIT) family protein